MTDNELERANKLKLEIKELESFLFLLRECGREK